MHKYPYVPPPPPKPIATVWWLVLLLYLLLVLVPIGLKLGGWLPLAAWSWWKVLSPLWVPWPVGAAMGWLLYKLDQPRG